MLKHVPGQGQNETILGCDWERQAPVFITFELWSFPKRWEYIAAWWSSFRRTRRERVKRCRISELWSVVWQKRRVKSHHCHFWVTEWGQIEFRSSPPAMDAQEQPGQSGCCRLHVDHLHTELSPSIPTNYGLARLYTSIDWLHMLYTATM